MNFVARFLIPAIAIGIAIYHMDSNPRDSKSMRVVLIMGGPGSGKGTQSARLAQDFGLVHVSSGDLLRERAKKGGELGQLILQAMSKGQLVSHGVTSRVLDEQFHAIGRDKVFLLDGFPRSIQNFLSFQEHTNNTLNVLGVVLLNCSDLVMQQRIVERAMKVNRPDNNLDAIRHRIKFFNQETNQLLHKLRDFAMILAVNGDGSADQVYAGIRVQVLNLGLQQINYTSTT